MDLNHGPDDSSARPTNGSDGGRGKDFLRRARATVKGLPSWLDEQIKRNPYAVVGIACGAGIGIGVIFSSRIVRGLLTATATAAVLELARGLVRQNLSRLEVA
jgi:hypothetical protein